MEKDLLDVKIKHDDHETVRKKLEELGARLHSKLHQVDTYYEIKKGKLKLRENLGLNSELIYYERERLKGVRSAKITILKIDDPQACKSILEKLTKPIKVVDKVREIYYLDKIKIHLDNVKGIGRFVEFECEEVNDEMRKRFLSLISELGLNKDKVVEGSYSDMV